MTQPKGKLIAIGGGVDKGEEAGQETLEDGHSNFFEIGILHRFIEELEGKDHRVEIITTASGDPARTGKMYVDAFQRLENNNVGIIDIKEREDTLNPDFQDRIQKAEGILFTGGNQLRLTTILGGTDFQKILLDRYANENFVVAGTSAGAMAMSNTMIYEGSSTEALLKGEVKTSRGLGFIKDVTFDSHFVKRGRFGRICQSIASNPVGLGIGLGEDTGILITKGDHMEAIGSGLITIIDGSEIKYTNLADISDGEPISIENLKVHILSKGDKYILSERRFVA